MKLLTLAGSGTLLFLAFSIGASPAEAQTFVSSTGNDANPCTRTAPCRTLQRGVNVVAFGREVIILNSGQYGRATINKSITVSATDIDASISAAAGNTGILINNPNVHVVLRGLLVNGGNVGSNGIHIADAASVHIVNCEVERFSGFGIAVDDAEDVELFVGDTISRLNGVDGLAFSGNGTTGRLTIDNSRFENNAEDGIEVERIHATVKQSVFSGNGEDGIEVSLGRVSVDESTASYNGEAGFHANDRGQIELERSTSTDNSWGFLVHSNGTGLMSNSTFTDNDVGTQIDGTVRTRRNNSNFGNVVQTDNQGTVTVLAPI